MSVTLTRVPNGEDVWGKTHVQFVDVTLDNSYPASTGYVINAQDVGLKNLLGVKVVGGNKASGKLNYLADLLGTGAAGTPVSSLALRAFFPSGGAGSAPTTLADPAITEGAITVTNGAITAGAITMGGTAALTAGGDTVSIAAGVPAAGLTATAANPTQATTTATIAAGSATPGIAKEVGNTADLSSIIVRLMVMGF